MRPEDVGRPAYRLYRWAWACLDWLYPPRCGGCSKPGARWCAECQNSTHVISPPICERCGRPLSVPGYCSLCRVSPPRLTALRSWAVFNGSLRKALHRLKYNRDVALGDVLAQPLITMLFESGWSVDMITPVPLSEGRKRERGYNQAALLAWPVALGCGIDYQSKLLSKIRETRSQVGLSADQRRENVSGAYQSLDNSITGKRILVVDDITTTGATLDACAVALFNAGAKQVFGLTLARAFSDFRVR
jgi:competence protein ComFC